MLSRTTVAIMFLINERPSQLCTLLNENLEKIQP